MLRFNDEAEKEFFFEKAEVGIFFLWVSIRVNVCHLGNNVSINFFLKKSFSFTHSQPFWFYLITYLDQVNLILESLLILKHEIYDPILWVLNRSFNWILVFLFYVRQGLLTQLSIESSSFPVRSCLPFIRKDSFTHMHSLAVNMKEERTFGCTYCLENSDHFYYVFDYLFHSVCFFFPCRSLHSICRNLNQSLSRSVCLWRLWLHVTLIKKSCPVSFIPMVFIGFLHNHCG